MAKKAKKVTIRHRVDQLKDGVKYVNDEAINISDSLVDASLKTGAKWQKLMAKALKEGVVLFGKQQEMVLDTLEEMRDQYTYGNARFRKLVGFKLPKAQEGIKMAKAAKEEVTQTLKTAVKEGKEKSAKLVKAVKEEVKETLKAVEVKVEKEKATAKSDIAKDDLKIIDGIGPKIESLFNEAGISTLERLAATKVEDLKAILEKAGPRFKMHNPETWRTQAKEVISGK